MNSLPIANANAIDKLFPTSCSTRKRKFNPVDDCIVASNKKSCFSKTQRQHLTVIVLKEVPATNVSELMYLNSSLANFFNQTKELIEQSERQYGVANIRYTEYILERFH